MRLKLLFETVLLFVLSFTWLNAQVNNVTHGTGPFTTIQAAIDDAATVNGDVIEVGNGTYTESITIDKEITLQSVNGAAVTMIEGAGTTVITIDADNVVIDGFTITNPSGKHGIYAQDQSGITIRNNILDDIGSTDATTSGTNYGIAVVSSSANVDGVLIEDNTLTNISGGSGKKSVNGIALGWSTGSFDISNVTIQNNSITSLVASSTTPWGMYGIIVNHASGSSSNTGKTTNLNILNNTIENLAGYWIHGIGLEGLTPSAVVEGNTFANFIAEKAYDNYAVFFESNSYIGTVVINQNNFNTTRGIGIHSDLLSTLTTEVLDATENWWGDASGPSGTDLEGSGSVWGTDDSDASIVSYVDYSPWLGASTGTTPMTWYTDDSIQDAIDAASDDDIINVAAGTYTETLNVDKSLTISGATAAINKNGYTVPANYNWDDNVESIIKHPDPSGGYTTIVNIEDVDNVTFEGFIIQELNADGNLNTSLVRVYAHSKEITNITIRNNIIGPNTNVASQDGTHGRMGLYIVNHPYNNLGVVNSTISGNKIFDCKGNGNNIFLWSSYYVYGAPEPASMSGTVIEDNEIYGAHRSGIETAGGYSDLTIRNNKIYDNSGLPSDDPDYLKYGNGILLVRGSGDKSSGGSAFGPVNLTIENNEIYNNEKNGIYAGPVNENYTITGNDIHDNGWDGIQIDLEGHYYNPDFDPTSGPFSVYDASTNINFNDNDVYDNTLYGTRVYGTPTNGFELNAKNNWWGDPTGPYHATNNTSATGDSVSDNVVYSPWIANSNDTPHDEDNLWTYYVDASNPDAINDVLYDPGFVKGDTVVANGGVFNAITIDKEFVLIGMNGAEILNGSPAITISSNNVTVTGFTFSFGTADYAIKVTGDYSGIVVKNCEFLVTNGIDNDNGGPYYVLAVNNDWGDTSGPTHVVANPGGSGSTITDYVIFESGGLVEPLNNITGISILPTFTWEEFGVAPSVSYKLLISENSDMSS
ncbi:MAG: right-handed parallel beta-helix repeat-containing protein, partial [Ignavibacteria bacterium]